MKYSMCAKWLANTLSMLLLPLTNDSNGWAPTEYELNIVSVSRLHARSSSLRF